jgi:hypothetical protein
LAGNNLSMLMQREEENDTQMSGSGSAESSSNGTSVSSHSLLALGGVLRVPRCMCASLLTHHNSHNRICACYRLARVVVREADEGPPQVRLSLAPLRFNAIRANLSDNTAHDTRTTG